MNKQSVIVFDSCSLINLINGNQLDAILLLPGFTFIIGELVYAEVSKIPFQKIIVDKKIASNEIHLFAGELPLDLLSNLFAKFCLGDGETECICISSVYGYRICSDDNKARKAIISEVGLDNLMGSLRLLKMAVSHNVIICRDAKFSYLEMKLKGAYLPNNIEDSYFCND